MLQGSHRAVSVGLLLAALCLSACGGGGSDSGSATPATPGTPTTPAQPANTAPVANAGTDLSTYKNQAVSLDASASTDADANALSYRWTQTAGPAVTLSSATSARPAFTAPAQSGVLTFALTVNDGKVDSTADAINVTVQNRAPSATVAAVDALTTNSMAMLDASASSDPDGDALNFQWQQVAGPTLTLTVLPNGRVQFSTPGSTGSIVLRLMVSDGETTSIQISITINIVAAPPTPTIRVPVAMVGADVVTGKRARVQLQGSAYDPDGTPITRYQWEQTAGTPVTIQNANSRIPTFTAPATTGELRFAFRAGHATELSDAVEMKVTVRNSAPIFNGSATLTPVTPRTDDALTLAATAIDFDSDPLTLTYEWRRNDVVVPGQVAATYPASLTTKNDVIKVRLTASDGTESVSVQASTTILDSLPVISGALPTTLNYGDTLYAALSVSDADGDSIDVFEMAHGPAGFTVSSTGTVSWTPDGPLFDRNTDFNWGVRIRGTPSSLLAGSIRVNDSARKYPMRRFGIPVPAAKHGIRIGDFDGDGSTEMLVLSRTGISEVGRSGARYVEKWVYPFSTQSPGYYRDNGFAAGDIDGDHKQEIFFASGYNLIKLDGASRREVARRETYQNANETCAVLELADLDRDGSLELICLSVDGSFSNFGKLVVLDPATLTVEWSVALPYSNAAYGDMTVGNVDADASLEIVLSSGDVFDGATHQRQWGYGPGFGREVSTGDFDGDGIEEIVAATGSLVRAYGAVVQSPLWEITPNASTYSGAVNTLLVRDVDGDGRADVVVGDNSRNQVSAFHYDPATQTAVALFRLGSPQGYSRATGLAFGDVDSDGQNELVWGEGLDSSGRDTLVVASTNPAAIEWSSVSEPQLDSPFVGGALATLAPGKSRLMFAVPRTNSGYDDLRAIALDPTTGTLEYSIDLGDNWTNITSLAVADYDGDAADELFTCSATYGYDGYFLAYDFAGRRVEWSTAPANGDHCTDIAAADVTADGHADLISATTNGYVYVYDVLNQSLLWKSTALSGQARDVNVADLDHDGRPEIIALAGDRIYVYGRPGASTTSYLERANVQVSAGDVLVADADGDGSIEIYALIAGGSIQVFDAGLHLIRTLNLGSPGASLHLEDSGTARKNLLVGMAVEDSYNYPDVAELRAVDCVSGALIWRSPKLIGTVPRNSVFFVDTDGDGHKEISFATSLGMYLTR